MTSTQGSHTSGIFNRLGTPRTTLHTNPEYIRQTNRWRDPPSVPGRRILGFLNTFQRNRNIGSCFHQDPTGGAS